MTTRMSCVGKMTWHGNKIKCFYATISWCSMGFGVGEEAELMEWATDYWTKSDTYVLGKGARWKISFMNIKCAIFSSWI